MREHDVEEIRSVMVEHALNRRGEILLADHALRRDAEPLANLDEIGEDVRLILSLVVLDVRRAEVGVAAVGAVEAILPLNDHAEVLVVEHEHLHREVLGVQGGELLDVHHEGAVAVDVNHRLARARGGGADGGGEAETHGTETAGGEPVAGLVEFVMLRRPHLVLPHPRADHRLALRHLAEQLHGVLWHDVIGRVREGEGELLALFLDLLDPVAEVQLGLLAANELVERAKRRLDVAEDSCVRLLVLANLRGIDVDVHDGGALRERLELTRHAIVEAHAEGEQEVARVDGVVGVDGAVHAEHVEAQGIARRVATKTHEGVGDGDARRLDELLELGGGVEAAAAGVHDGTLRLLDHVEHLLHLRRGGGRGEAAEVAVQAHLGPPVRHRHLLLDILGDVDEHGAGTAGGGEEERLANDTGNILHVHHQVVVLGDLTGDLHGGRLLERVRADHAPGHLTGDGHHGHGVEQRVRETGHEVRRAGTGCRDAHANLARALGVALRGKHLALLVAAQDVAHARHGLGQRLVDLHRRATGVREDAIDALALERLDENVGALAGLVVGEARLEVTHGSLRRELLHLLRGELRLGEERRVHARLREGRRGIAGSGVDHGHGRGRGRSCGPRPGVDWGMFFSWRGDRRVWRRRSRDTGCGGRWDAAGRGRGVGMGVGAHHSLEGRLAERGGGHGFAGGARRLGGGTGWERLG